MKKGLLSGLMILALTGLLSGSAVGLGKDIIVFTPDQITALESRVTEHNAAMQAIVTKLEGVVDALVQEAVKDEGEDVPKTWRKDPKKIDTLIRKATALTGDLLKEKTAFLLAAKDVLTPEQRKALIKDLEYRIDFFDNGSPFMFKIDELSDILGLNETQVKDIMKHRTDMLIRELKLKLDITNEILDIKALVKSGAQKSGSVDQGMMKIADFGAKILKNRVEYILTARKVLTQSQRLVLRQLILMNMEALITVD